MLEAGSPVKRHVFPVIERKHVRKSRLGSIQLYSHFLETNKIYHTIRTPHQQPLLQ
jgi:hypothetical protein